MPTADISEELAKLFVGAERLKELMHSAMAAAKECASGSRSLTPVLTALIKQAPDDVGDIQICSLAVDFNEFADKRRILEQIGRNIYAKQAFPVALILTSEAWLVTRHKDDPRTGQPRDQPDRVEIIQAVGKTLGTKIVRLSACPVQRDAAGKMVLGEWELLHGEGGSPIIDHVFRGFMQANHKRTN